MDSHRTSECGELRPWLVDHSHGRSGRWQEKIDRHLSGCSECREWIGFIRTIDEESCQARPGARLGFEKRLERIAGEARSRVIPGRFQRRFLAGFVGAAAAAIALIGGLLPTIKEAIDWVSNFGTGGYTILCLCVSLTLILSCPILIFRAINRMEGS